MVAAVVVVVTMVVAMLEGGSGKKVVTWYMYHVGSNTNTYLRLQHIIPHDTGDHRDAADDGGRLGDAERRNHHRHVKRHRGDQEGAGGEAPRCEDIQILI